MVASPSFYGNNGEPFHTIIIENSVTREEFSIWIEKMIVFLEVFHAFKSGVDVLGTDSLDLTTENDKASKYCFVPYYKWLQENQLRSDGMNKAFGCVCMPR